MADFPIPFDAGVHQDVDAAVAHEGTLVRVTNGRIPRQGGVVKRFGTKAVSKTVEPSGVTQAIGTGRPNALGYVQGRDILTVSGRAYARDHDTQPSWTEVGRPSSFLPRKAHFIALDETATVQSTMHVAALGDFICVVYAETETPPAGTVTQVVIELFDAGMVRRYTNKLSSRDLPRVFVVGSVFVITYKTLDTVAGSHFGRTFDPATATLGGETVIRAKIGNSDAYDAAPFDATTFVFLARGALALMTMSIVNLAFASTASQAVVCNNSQTVLARICGTPGEGVWGAYVDAVAGTPRVFVANATLSATTGALTSFGNIATQLSMTRRDATTVWFVWQDIGLSALPGMYARSVSTASVLGASSIALGIVPASSPFGGTLTGFGIWVTNQVSLAGATVANASRYSLLRCESLFAEGYADLLLCVELTSALTANYVVNGEPPAIAVRGEKAYFAAREQLGNFVQSLYLYEYEDNTTRRGAWRQAIEGCQAGVVAGGHLQEIPSDRRNSLLSTGTIPTARGFDNGFLKAPDASIATGAGGTLTAGTYQVFLVYEYIDTEGRRHQSEPSGLLSIVSLLNDKLTLTVTPSMQTERELSNDQVRGVIAPYMTAANGSTFYRCSNFVIRSANTLGTAPPASFTIVLPNPPDTKAEPVYTAGGELRNSPSPSHRFALFSHDALWVCGMWDPRMIERSKTVLPGTPPRFTLANQFRAIAPFEVSALAELDGQILVIGVDGLAVMSADGPNNQGVPALVAPTILSPLGIIPGGEVAVIRIPMGVVFPGRRGLYIAPRGGGDPEFLGSPVQGDLATVYSATEHFEPADGAIPGSRLVSFAITNTAGVTYIATMDQDTLQWVSVDVLPVTPELLGAFGPDLVSLPLNSSSSNILTRASTRNAGELGNPTDLIVETAHCRPFGLLGWGYARRVQLLLTLPVQDPVEAAGGPRVVVEFARDGAPFVALATYIPTGVGVDAAEWQLPGDQPCNSFRFRVTATATGAGPTLHGLTVNVDQVDGLPRLAPGKRS